MRIQLIIPRDLTYRVDGGLFNRTNSYPALTLTTLAALVPDDIEADISLLDEGVDATPIDFSADLIGISVLSAAAPRAYEIARQARSHGVHVVLGGYHVTNCPEEAAVNADTIFVGPAEDTWPRFLSDWQAGRSAERYETHKLPQLAGQPWPRRDLLKRGAYLPYATLFASRGCACQCSFCNVSQHLRGRRLQRPVREVIAEIEALHTRKVIFLDPYFHGDREYARQLMLALRDLRLRWGCLTCVGVGNDPETLRLMQDSGCLGVLVGFESLCNLSLQEMSKPVHDIQGYMSAVAGFRDHGMSVLGCFVFGFDHDTPDIFQRTVDFVEQSGMDLARYAVLTPFPGTPLFAQMEAQGRIISRDLQDYDCQHVVFQPRGMSVAQLQKGYQYAWLQTYRTWAIARRIWRAGANHGLALLSNISMARYCRSA
jgi:radical SAM superfamily enzyme YgiQ (UPF0313 family)